MVGVHVLKNYENTHIFTNKITLMYTPKSADTTGVVEQYLEVVGTKGNNTGVQEGTR